MMIDQFVIIGMEREKQHKLEPIRTQGHPIQRASYYSRNNRFRLTDRQPRTEPSVENIKQELPRKHSKNPTEFSEEYMSLVNKLRLNLKHMDRRPRLELIQERQYLFGNENQRSAIIEKHAVGKQALPQAQQNFPREPLRISNFKKRSFTTFSNEEPETKTFRPFQAKLTDQSFFGHSEEKLSHLPSVNSLHKARYHQDTIKEVTEQNSPQHPTKKQRKNGSKKKQKAAKTSHQHSDQQCHSHPQQEGLQQINENYEKVDQLCFHIQVLINILQKFNQDTAEETPDRLIQLLKEYVLGNKKAVGGGRLLQDDISHLDCIYRSEAQQNQLRTLIFYERILIVFCVDLLASRGLGKHQHDVNLILHALLGIYLYLLYLLRLARPLPPYAEGCLENLRAKSALHNIHAKKEVQTSVFFISKKLLPMLKLRTGFLGQVKVLVVEFESRRVTINRAFYELLRLYAIYLNNNQSVLEKHYQALKTFATCPSPYLTKPPSKPYTLVLDLDETLIHSRSAKLKLEVFMRPFLKEFLEVMARHYELVVFTSSLPEYSEQIIAQLPLITHKLYRYHTTRLKHRHIKDLSRLGRSLHTVIMVDNEEENFVLQKQNGICIPQWRGEDPHDQELNILGLFLNDLAVRNVGDVRQHLPQYKEFRNSHR